MAAALIRDLKKCEAEVCASGIEAGAAITTIAFDYVITVCNVAKENLPELSGKPLFFHYHFKSPVNEPELEELKATMKQYFERFCKMYLNEFS